MPSFALLRNAAVALALMLLSGSVRAADYPDQPIHVILTYTPGGVSDGLMRLLEPKMEQVLGQKLIIEAKPGAAGNLGTMDVAKSPPDGYTLVVTATNNFVINQFTMDLDFDPLKALTPVAKLADVPLVLFSNPEMPAKNFAEFMAYAKDHPGKLNFGSPAPGTVNQLLLERIKQDRGLDMQHVPFRGSPEGVLALLQNNIQLFTVGLAAGVGQLKQGKLTALAVASKQRLPDLPDVPTLSESGLPGLTASNWWGMAAPAGTSKEVIDKLRKAVETALREPQVIERYRQIGLMIPTESPEEFAAGLPGEAAFWSETVKRGHIKIQ